MITKHSDWELGAYLYEYNGAPFSSVSLTNPINLLSETFFSNCTKYFINKKFFYFDISKDTYLLKCNVEFILRFFITLTTGINNTLYWLNGYWSNPLQIKTKSMPGMSINTTANTQTTYQSGVFSANVANWIFDKNSSFFLGTQATDTVTFNNNIGSFVCIISLRQI